MDPITAALIEYGIIGIVLAYFMARDFIMSKKISEVSKQQPTNGRVAKHDTDIQLIKQDVSYLRKDMSDAVRRIEQRLERIEQNQANRMRPGEGDES